MTLFYTNLERTRIEVRLIEKLGRKASNALFIDDLLVPAMARIGGAGGATQELIKSFIAEQGQSKHY